MAGRYDLHTPIAVGHGRTMWEGHDTVLDRTVGVLVLDRDHPRAAEVLLAAQRAARVEHRYLQRIVDVDTDHGRVFVVTRWSSAQTLADLLAAGPLDTSVAASVARDVAAGLAAADAAGVHHLLLDPRDVLVGEGGTTVTGLAVRAAISPPPETDTPGSVTDARRIGALLYAALTGRWPDDSCHGLTAAPLVDGQPARPRQVRAGVPTGLDVVTCRALGQRVDDSPTLDDAAAIHTALDAVQTLPGQPAEAAAPQPMLSRTATVGLVAVASLLAIGVALLGWTVFQDRRTPQAADETVSPGPTLTSVPATPGTPLPVPIKRALAFDPQGDQQENDATVPLAIDNLPDTAWTTLTYNSRDLGGLKDGIGLQLKLSATTRVEGIDLRLVGRGSDLQVLTARGQPTQLSDYQPAVTILGASDVLSLRFRPQVADSVLIWFTGLPATGTGYQVGVANVVVRGAPTGTD